LLGGEKEFSGGNFQFLHPPIIMPFIFKKRKYAFYFLAGVKGREGKGINEKRKREKLGGNRIKKILIVND